MPVQCKSRKSPQAAVPVYIWYVFENLEYISFLDFMHEVAEGAKK